MQIIIKIFCFVIHHIIMCTIERGKKKERNKLLGGVAAVKATDVWIK